MEKLYYDMLHSDNQFVIERNLMVYNGSTATDVALLEGKSLS